jgi:hypothetical protein
MGGSREKNPTTWRINFSRVQWDTEFSGGRYIRKTDSSKQRPLPEHNWVWSPQGVVNMHLPERWGLVHFSKEEPASVQADLPLPQGEEVRRLLWLLYYKQQAFRRQHKSYATALEQINLPAAINNAAVHCTLSLEATAGLYTATARLNTGHTWQITHEGKITQISAP